MYLIQEQSVYSQNHNKSTVFKYKYKMTKFKRLVAYGCSYTQGDELLDEEYVPGANEIKKTQGLDAFLQTLYKKYPDLTKAEYNELAKSHAWPRHLADRIGIPWTNRSRPGNSIYNMIYSIDQDLVNGDILDTDLVILGITSPNRLIYINHDGRDQTLHLGYLHGWPQGFEHGYPFFIKWCTDPVIMFQFSIALRTLLHLAQTRLKNQLYFVECDPRAMHLTKYIEPPLHPSVVKTLEPIYSEFTNSGLMISDRNMYKGQPKEYLLALGHLAEAAHFTWAKHLYENCQRMGLTS